MLTEMPCFDTEINDAGGELVAYDLVVTLDQIYDICNALLHSHPLAFFLCCWWP